MAEFNRDIDQQESMAQELNEKAASLDTCVSELIRLLENMKSSGVFDETSTAAVEAILAVAKKIEPSAQDTKNLSQKIQEQAEDAKRAQDILKQIA